MRITVKDLKQHYKTCKQPYCHNTKMKGLLISCGLFTVVSGVLAIGEVIYSLCETSVSTGMGITGISSQLGIQELTLLGVESYQTLYLLIKYVGPFAFLPSCYFLCKLYRRAHALERDIEAMWKPSALILFPCISGVFTLAVRVVLLLCIIIKSLNTDFTGPSLEPNYAALGAAATCGIIAMFLYLGYLISFMYKRIKRYEKQNLPGVTKSPGVFLICVPS